MSPAIVHVTAEHAADDARVTARELATLLDRHGEAWIVARPPRGTLDPRLTFVEGPSYARATRHRRDWPALDAAVGRTPAPRIVHAHEPETVLAARHFRWCPRERLVYDAHEYHGPMMAHRARGIRRWILRRLGDRRHAAACRAAGHVIAVNEELAAEARRHGATSVTVLTNAPRLAGTAAACAGGHASVRADEDADLHASPNTGRVAPAPPRDPDRLIHVGGLSEPRGVVEMLEAFGRVRAAHPAATLELVGPALDDVARRAIAEPPDGVEVAGPLPPARARERMLAASVGLIPFQRVVHFRGRPVKLLEYAAAGLSVVTTAGGPKEAWVREHAAGAVVPTGDAAALADACLARLRDPALARAEADRGAAAAAEVAWERVEAPRLLALYDAILATSEDD